MFSDSLEGFERPASEYPDEKKEEDTAFVSFDGGMDA